MKINPIGIVIILLALGVWIVLSMHKRHTFRQLLTLFQAGKFDEYYSLLEAPLTKYHYPKFNRKFMRLNGLIVQKRHHAVEEAFDDLLSSKITPKQHREVVLKAFDYYLGRKKKPKVEALLAEIKSWNDEKNEKACQRLYDIIMLDSYEHIDELEHELEGMKEPAERQYAEFLLAMQYKSKGDSKMEKHYLKMAEDELKRGAAGK